MERIEKTIEVNCPVRTVYNQWTQFEDFPKFMAGVKNVRQLDDTRLHWEAEVWGKDEEWESEITEQTPDERISWRSTAGARNAGTVRFEPVGPDRTRVRLALAYEPEGVVENVGDMMGALDGQVQSSVEEFKKFIESRGRETGAWRGSVHDSEPADMEDRKGHVEETENLEQQRSRDKAREVEATLDRNAVKGRTLDPSPSQRTVQPSDKTRRSE
jgi:ribosome-associated toxin RatA of RatAB toxin-antitoxin module